MARREDRGLSSARGVVIGLVSATVVGAVTAFLWNASKGKGIKSNLSDLYEETSEKIYELADQIKGRGSLPPKRNLKLTVGAIAGGILGISAVVLLSNDSTRQQLKRSFKSLTDRAHTFTSEIGEQAHDVAENFEDRVGGWINSVQKLIDTVNHSGQKHLSNVNGKNHNLHSFDKILDWAIIGAQLFQSLKK